MSGWIVDAISKRRRGLYVRQTPSGPVATVQLRTEFADMDFAAVYQAAVPGVVAIGGTWDPATAGAAVTLTDGDLTASFAGIGAAFGQADIGSNLGAFAFEVGYQSADGLNAIGVASAFIFALDGNNAYGQGNGATSQFLNADGTWFGFDPAAPIAPLVDGDVIGFILDTPTGSYWVFRNGAVVVAAGGVGASGNPYFACVTRA